MAGSYHDRNGFVHGYDARIPPATGLIPPDRDRTAPGAVKEAEVGMINGLVLGLLLGGVAYLWKGSPWLGAVVGGAAEARRHPAPMASIKAAAPGK